MSPPTIIATTKSSIRLLLRLFNCSLDKLTEHEKPLFAVAHYHCKDPFQAEFQVLLCDLTNGYFKRDPPGEGKRNSGCIGDKRSIAAGKATQSYSRSNAKRLGALTDGPKRLIKALRPA